MLNIVLQVNISKIIQTENISATLPVQLHTVLILSWTLLFSNYLKFKKIHIKIGNSEN